MPIDLFHIRPNKAVKKYFTNLRYDCAYSPDITPTRLAGYKLTHASTDCIVNDSNKHYHSRINKAIDYIDGHLDEPISLSTLAGIANYSPYHFHRVFKAVSGETVNNLTNRIRIGKAARLLKFSTQPISEISIACGFSSPATLARSFKQYFGLSPTAYRDGEEIKNSKIRKALFEVNKYHCAGDLAALAEKFPVTIKQLPERRVAYLRVTNAFREGVVINAFQRIIEWAKTNNVYESGSIFGMSIDDPEVTPKEKYRYEACITIPECFNQKTSDPLIETTSLPPCMYAVTLVKGDINLVGQGFDFLFDSWLINSEYECEHSPGIEVFLEKENVCNWEHFNLEIMIPVKKTKY